MMRLTTDEGDAACAKYDCSVIKLFSDRLNKLETMLESALNAVHAKPQRNRVLVQVSVLTVLLPLLSPLGEGLLLGVG